MKSILLFFVLLPAVILSQKCFPGKPAENLHQIVQASAKLPRDINYELASYDFKPLKLVDSLVNKVPDFSLFVSGPESVKLKEQFGNFYATFNYTCVTYVYEFRKGYVSAVLAGGEVDNKINTPYGTLDCLSYRKGTGTPKISRLYVVTYTSLTKKNSSQSGVDLIPIIFYGFVSKDKHESYWYFVEAKATGGYIPVNHSLTALIYDNDKVDGDSVLISGKFFALTKDTLRISFLDSLPIYVVSQGKISQCTFRVVIQETNEIRDETGSKGQTIVIRPKKPKILVTK